MEQNMTFGLLLYWLALLKISDWAVKYATFEGKILCLALLEPSPSVIPFFPISEFSYKLIRFLLLYSSIIKSDNEMECPMRTGPRDTLPHDLCIMTLATSIKRHKFQTLICPF